MNALTALARSALKTASTVSAGELEERAAPNREPGRPRRLLIFISGGWPGGGFVVGTTPLRARRMEGEAGACHLRQAPWPAGDSRPRSRKGPRIQPFTGSPILTGQPGVGLGPRA